MRRKITAPFPHILEGWSSGFLRLAQVYKRLWILTPDQRDRLRKPIVNVYPHSFGMPNLMSVSVARGFLIVSQDGLAYGLSAKEPGCLFLQLLPENYGDLNWSYGIPVDGVPPEIHAIEDVGARRAATGAYLKEAHLCQFSC